MRAQMVITIDLGEVGGHNYDQIEHKVEEVMSRLPMRSFTELDFKIDGKTVGVQVQVSSVSDPGDTVDNGIDGDDAMMTMAGGFSPIYQNEEDLLKHMDDLGVTPDSPG